MILFSLRRLSKISYVFGNQNLPRIKKVGKLIEELKLHPATGTGHPEQLKGDRCGQWSRMITKKHRLVYEIIENEVHVDILSAYGHYDDK